MEKLATKPNFVFWPYGIILFFIVILLVNLTMLFFASRDYTGTLDTHPYQRALNYQTEIDQLQAYKDAGYQMKIIPAPITISIYDAEDKLVTGLKVYLDAKQASAVANDILTELQESSPGSYTLPNREMTKGSWLLEIVFAKGAQHFRYKVTHTFE